MPRQLPKKVCIVENCDAKHNEKFHKFPLNAAVRQKWLENLGITSEYLKTERRPHVCHRHFGKSQESAQKKNKNKSTCHLPMPTLHLAKTKGLHQSTSSIRNPRKCSVKKCTTRSPETVHTFPVNAAGRARWLEICQLEDNRKHFYICRRHFRPSFVSRNRILKGAYPERNLGLESDPLQESEISVSELEEEEEGEEEEEEQEEEEDEQEEEEQHLNPAQKLKDNNCKKCSERDSIKSLLLQLQIEQVRLKLLQLEQQLQLKCKHIEEEQQEEHLEEEEYIYLLLK